MKIACQHCMQDWLHPYRIKNTRQTFLLCAECESVWLPGQDAEKDTENFLSEILGDPPAGTHMGMIEAISESEWVDL